jgi:penicillin-binding protein 1A
MPDPEDRLGTSAPPKPVRAAPLRTSGPKRKQSRFLAFVRGASAVVTIIVFVGAATGAVVGYTIYEEFAADLPSLDGLRTYQPPVLSRVYSGDDRLIAELAQERRIFVPFSAIPDVVTKAFIAAEDKSFYEHKGVDPMAIARAAVTDLQRIGESRRPVGASTITQQVARNMLLGTNDVSFRRKAKEALLALRLERVLSKQRILELYLNMIYLGQGSYGVAAAAQTYFNKPLDQLDIAQAASLAALPKSPTNYNPFHEPDSALDRRNWVIDRMVETGAISGAQGKAAQAEPLGVAEYQRVQTVPGADWFAAEVKRQLIERFGQDQASQGGLIVHTSLDPALQTLADDTLRNGLMAYDRSHGGWRGPAGHLGAEIGLHMDWAARLAEAKHPAGMLPGWRLCVVLEETGGTAKVGWLDDRADPNSPAPTVSTIRLSDVGWGHTAKPDGESTGPIRRMEDVAARGDMLLMSLDGREGAQGEAPAPRTGPAHLTLRQIPAVAGALVSLDPTTGRVLAMSGGWSAEVSQFDRATQALRQPGSSFKPFVYLTAMEKGISPSARFLDAPFVLGDWRPSNYELNTGGPTPLHVALEQSLNLVTVRVAQHVGMDEIAKTAIFYHLYDAMPRVLPASLGAVETTVLREAGGYAAIAEGGRQILPSLIDSVQDRTGNIVWRPPSLVLGAGDPAQPPTLFDPRQQGADPQSAFQMVKMMEGVIQNGTGKPVAGDMDRPVAGKTGTSQDFNDAWFAGFTPDLVTVVWVGFDNPQTLGDKQTGAAVAGPIWRHFMDAALENVPAHDFRVPDDVEIDKWGCGAHMCEDAFKPDQEPGNGSVGGLDAVSSSSDGGGRVSMMDSVSGDNQTGQAPPPPAQGSGTGVDSGVGGLY